MIFGLTQEQAKKYLINCFKFTTPGLAVLFASLATGANWKVSLLAGLYIFYSNLSDLFKKIDKSRATE